MESTRHNFGDRWQFGIECELMDCELDPWGSREPFGSFWLWVGGRAVGNTDATEQLVHAFSMLAASVRRSGQRPDSRFQGMANLDKLDLVRWVRFGEDEEFDGERWGAKDLQALRQEDFTQYEVVPIGYSPFSDDWEAILLESDEIETFVWRRRHGNSEEVAEFSVPQGAFSRVATEACQWFEQLRSTRIDPVKRDPKDGIRLAKRIYNQDFPF